MNKTRRNLIIAGSFFAVIVVVALVLAIHAILVSGITSGPDKLFGDQHLKTAVALIELYKVRYGKYPKRLSDLTFIGEWDQIALNNVSYYPNADLTAYYVEVRRGWVGKPDLQMPPEFWQGTGYDPSLKPPADP